MITYLLRCVVDEYVRKCVNVVGMTYFLIRNIITLE